MPAPATGAGEVFDVCDDAQAIAAGLDGGRLEAARANLGLSCDDAETEDSRYQLLDYGGQLHNVGLVRSPDGTFDFDKLPIAEWMSPPSGLTLGSANEDKSQHRAPDDVVGVAKSSLNVRGTRAVGVVANMTTRYARAIVVRLEGPGGESLGFARLPFALTAGESVWFEAELSREVSVSDVATSVTADLSDKAPQERSMSVTDNGCWSPAEGQDVGDYDGGFDVSTVVALKESAGAVCSAAVEAMPAQQLPEVAPVITAPTLRIAALDRDGQLISVADVLVKNYVTDKPTEALDLREDPGGFVTYYLPARAASVQFWGWGAES